MSAVPSPIAIEVAPHPPELVGPVGLRLAAGACVADALAALGIAADTDCRLGIWGREAAPATRLGEGDRIEFYRPLVNDPKAARRIRAKSR